MQIAALVSGGVDSSLALALLKQQQAEVTAFYLKIWLEDELMSAGDCAWEEDLDYVEKTCKRLGVPLQVLSLQKEYYERVVAETIAEIKLGLTPNPDIWCNEKIKFGSFYTKIPPHFTKVATGHYAQTEARDGKYYLKQAPDPVKDQTYFLSRLTQPQLARALFPIGHLPKSEVRRQAAALDLPASRRKDSQGICFLGKFKFSEFVRAHLGEMPGEICEQETKTVLGTHLGFWFYTLGQRQGLGLSGGPWFVTGKDIAANRILVSRVPLAAAPVESFTIGSLNFIPDPPPDGTYLIKLRHGAGFCEGALGKNGDEAMIHLQKPQTGIAPGQSAVLYQNGFCLGGGVIIGTSEAEKSA